MSNRVLTLWIFAGLATVVLLVHFFLIAKKRMVETTKAQEAMSLLRQQNTQLALENQALRNGSGYHS